MTQQFALWDDTNFDEETHDSGASFRQIVSYGPFLGILAPITNRSLGLVPSLEPWGLNEGLDQTVFFHL
jgi:hypothetical protein